MTLFRRERKSTRDQRKKAQKEIYKEEDKEERSFETTTRRYTQSIEAYT